MDGGGGTSLDCSPYSSADGSMPGFGISLEFPPDVFSK